MAGTGTTETALESSRVAPTLRRLLSTVGVESLSAGTSRALDADAEEGDWERFRRADATPVQRYFPLGLEASIRGPAGVWVAGNGTDEEGGVVNRNGSR